MPRDAPQRLRVHLVARSGSAPWQGGRAKGRRDLLSQGRRHAVCRGQHPQLDLLLAQRRHDLFHRHSAQPPDVRADRPATGLPTEPRLFRRSAAGGHTDGSVVTPGGSVERLLMVVSTPIRPTAPPAPIAIPALRTTCPAFVGPMPAACRHRVAASTRLRFAGSRIPARLIDLPVKGRSEPRVAL